MSSSSDTPQHSGQLTPFGAQSPLAGPDEVDHPPHPNRRPAVDEFFDLENNTSAFSSRPAMAFSLLALLRYKWSMAAVFLLIAGAAVPAVWFLIVPTYEAQAVIRVSPVGTKIIFETENNGMVPFYNSFLNSQINIIRSREVLDEVLDDPQVQQTEWYNQPVEPLWRSPLTQMERLREAIVARPRSRTELIDVSMSARSGRDAQVIVDAVVEEYLRLTEERLDQLDIRRLDKLYDERDKLHAEIKDLTTIRSGHARRIGASDPADRLAQANNVWLDLVTEHARLERDREVAADELAAMPAPAADEASGGAAEDDAPERAAASRGAASRGMSSGDGGLYGSPQFYMDAEWRRRQTAVAAARHALESGRQQYGPSHPRISALTRDVDYAEQMLATREEQLVAQWRDAPLGLPNPQRSLDEEPVLQTRGMLEQRIRRLSRTIDLLEEEIKEQENRVDQIGGVAGDVALLDQQLAYKQETLDLLLKRIEELELEQNAPARISIAGRAVAPSRPSRDRRPIFSAMAFCGALAAAIAVGYLRLMSDQRVHEVGEVRKTMSAPFLGQLPVLPNTCKILPACTPAIMEDVRMVRTALLERINGSAGGASVLVTSSSSQAGKTSVTILLAQSLAGLGKRVLLVEGDLRHPTLANRLDIRGHAAGLVSILTRRAADEAAITRPRRLDFDVLPAGDVSNGFNPDLLANGAMSDALFRWKQKYDVVLLDSPPVLAVADVRILGGLCDGTMMVMRSAHCRRADVMESYAMLAASGCTLLGTVLVGGSRRSGYSAYYGSYGNGGADGSAPQLAAPSTAETSA